MWKGEGGGEGMVGWGRQREWDGCGFVWFVGVRVRVRDVVCMVDRGDRTRDEQAAGQLDETKDKGLTSFAARQIRC